MVRKLILTLKREIDLGKGYKKIFKIISIILIICLCVFVYNYEFNFYFKKNFQIRRDLLLNEISNTTKMNDTMYNIWHRCDYNYFNNNEKCTKLKVPLNWNDINSSKIGIFVRRIGNPTPKRIVVMLSGGPGFDGSSYSEFAKKMYQNNKDQLYLLPDHRGTGFSENLFCSKDKRILKSEDIDDLTFSECVTEIKNKWNIDLKYFNSWQAGKDILAILDLYPNVPVSIYAVSYGTIWAQRVISINNKNIDRVYLESPAIIGATDFSERNIDEPIKIVFENCNKSLKCSEKLGVKSFEELKEIFIKVNNGTICKKEFDNITRKYISEGSVWLLQYNSTATLFPLLVSAINNCDMKRVNSIFEYKNRVSNTERGKYSYSSYLHYNIWCNEILNDKNMKNDFGFIDSSLNYCKFLPKYKLVDEDQNISFKGTKYKTIISYGSADTSTTPDLAIKLSKLFSDDNKILIKMENLAHSPFSFSVVYDDFYENKLYEGEKCNFEIVSEFFKGQSKWPNIQCIKKIYPPIYSSDKGIETFEKILDYI